MLLNLALGAPAALASERTVCVSDVQGRPARNVVVVATPKASPSTPARAATMVETDQVDRQFAPQVLAIQIGTQVPFANNDSLAYELQVWTPLLPPRVAADSEHRCRRVIGSSFMQIETSVAARAAEGIQLSCSLPQRAEIGLPASATERLLQLAFRYKY